MSTQAFEDVGDHRLQHFWQGGRDEWQCINCTDRRPTVEDFTGVECAA